MSFILGDLTLEDPNQYSESYQPSGEYNTTLKGGVRRSLRFKKKVWSLTWFTLSKSDFDLLLVEYNKDTTLTFVNTDLDIDVVAHFDIQDRALIAGTGTNFRGAVSIVLREV